MQFSLLSLFALTTITCLALAWWVQPEPVEVVALLQTTSAPVAVSDSAEQLLINKLHGHALLNDAIAIAGNGKLSMLHDRRDPASWLRKRLKMKALKNSTVSVTLTVPDRFANDAVEIVDYMTLRVVAELSVNAVRSRRTFTEQEYHNQFAWLQKEIVKTSQRLSNLRQTTPNAKVDLAQLESALQSQTQTLRQLRVDRRQSMCSPRIVQRATVVMAGN